MNDQSARSVACPTRVRVVHFADEVNRNDFIHNIAANCDPDQFELSVITLNRRGTLNSDPGPLRVSSLDSPGRLGYPRALVVLRRLLKAEGVSILHSHHYEPSLIASLATLGLPTRLVLGRHYSDTIYTFSRGVRRQLYLGIEGFCNSRAAAVVAPSAVVERILLLQGVPPAKVLRIPYGLDLSRFEAPGEAARVRLESEWPSGEGLRLLTVGRLHREKGLEHLLEALGLLHEQGVTARLLVVGDGPDRDRLASIAATRGIVSAVRFLGRRTDVLDLMAAAEVVVQPTLNEAFSQVMLEAMAMGRPLVMTDVGGARDVIEDQVSGVVVPIRDAVAMASAIRTLGDYAFRASLGARAARTIRERLDINRIAGEFEALYFRLGCPSDQDRHAA